MNVSVKEKEFSFGGCRFTRTTPGDFSSATKIVNIEVTFEEALKLHLAIGECIGTLNKHNRAMKEGRRTALNIALHVFAHRITINERNLLSS